MVQVSKIENLDSLLFYTIGWVGKKNLISIHKPKAPTMFVLYRFTLWKFSNGWIYLFFFRVHVPADVIM